MRFLQQLQNGDWLCAYDGLSVQGKLLDALQRRGRYRILAELAHPPLLGVLLLFYLLSKKFKEVA